MFAGIAVFSKANLKSGSASENSFFTIVSKEEIPFTKAAYLSVGITTVANDSRGIAFLKLPPSIVATLKLNSF